MLDRIRTFFAAPVFADEDKTRVARLLNVVLLTILVALVPILIVSLALYGIPSAPEPALTLLIELIMVLVTLVLLYFTRRGWLRVASTALLSLMWIMITIWIVTVSGISSDTSPIMYALIIVLAGLLLGGRATAAYTLASVVAVALAYYLESSGRLIIEGHSFSPMDLVFTGVPLLLTGLLLRYAVDSLSRALQRAQSNERIQIEANRELEALRESLELRVADRTHDLEHRTVQLQAAAEVSRAITSILDAEQLIWQVAAVIHERFGLYHVSVFQIDATGQWAEYRGGAGEGGYLLAEQGFRLQVGGRSMVGGCMAHAQARVAQDISAESARVDHPLVAATRSEAALPLIVRGEVIGALSVQSDRAGTFDRETVATLQTIADQVAGALDNARLFTESQQALETTRRAYGELSRQAWAERLRARTDWGYSYTGQAVEPAQGDWQPEMLQAIQTGQVVQSAGGFGSVAAQSSGTLAAQGSGTTEAVLAIPLRVREETVGVLSFYKGEEQRDETPAAQSSGTLAAQGSGTSGSTGWTAEEARLLERLVQQMGLALESAQFYEETQRRAIREQTAREVTSRMRTTLEVDAVLRTAAQEIRQALGLSSMTIRLTTDSESGRTEAAEGSGTSQRHLGG